MVSDNSMPYVPSSKDEHNYRGNEKLPLVNQAFDFNEGLQLLRRIRETPSLESLDVIIYTIEHMRNHRTD